MEVDFQVQTGLRHVGFLHWISLTLKLLRCLVWVSHDKASHRVSA